MTLLLPSIGVSGESLRQGEQEERGHGVFVAVGLDLSSILHSRIKWFIITIGEAKNWERLQYKKKVTMTVIV